MSTDATMSAPASEVTLLASAVEFEIAGQPWHIRIVKSIGYPVGENRSWYIYDSVPQLYWRDALGWFADTPSRFATPDEALASFRSSLGNTHMGGGA